MSAYLGSRIYWVIFIIIILTIAIGACTRKEIRLQNVSYNKGLEESENKMLLLNVVRASKRYPMYFSASDSVSGKHTLNPSLSTAFPFKIGPALSQPFTRGAGSHIELQSYDLNPSLSYSTGFASHSMANLATSKFINAILKPVGADRLEFYQDQGWPDELIFFMLVRELGIKQDLLEEINNDYQLICNGYYVDDKGNRIDIDPEYNFIPNYKRLCRRIAETIREQNMYNCKKSNIRKTKEEFTSKLKDSSGEKLIETVSNHERIMHFYENDPRKNICEYLGFTFVVRTLILTKVKFGSDSKDQTDEQKFSTKRVISKYKPEKDEKSGDIKKRQEEITDIKERSSPSSFVTMSINDPESGSIQIEFSGGGEGEEIVGANKVALDNKVFLSGARLTMRSPRDMLAYLGSAISLQLQSKRYTPKILVGPDYDAVPIFLVNTGLQAAASSAVHVKHQGTIYAVPRPGVGDVDEHRSMQSLALIRQFIAKGVERDDLPKPSTVIVGG